MKHSLLFLIVICLSPSSVSGQSFSTDMAPLIESSCIHCHDASTETGLNFEALGHNLGDAATFKKWESVFDRVTNGEMPPESESRPDDEELKTGLVALKSDLHSTSLAQQQKSGRVPARRLTKLEFGNTLRDLLLIEGDLTSSLPDESDSGGFDTVGTTQRFSAIHMESYLKAADEALNQAIRLEKQNYVEHEFDLMNNAFLNEFHDKALDQGGNITRQLDEGVAVFRDNDYLIRSDTLGFSVPSTGNYRITSTVEAIQSKRPVTLKIILKEPGGGARILKAIDLTPGRRETIEFMAYMTPLDVFYTTLVSNNEELGPLYLVGAKNFKGPGLALRSQKVAGPFTDSWPPPSTHQILTGIKLTPTKKSPQGPFEVQLDLSTEAHVQDIVSQFARRAFRRPPAQNELESFVGLAKPALDDGRDFVSALKISLRSILTSPQFLMFEEPPGKLDDYALANRLSYFLWKSMPDEQLFELAAAGKLSDSTVLKQQVERMLADEKSNRFVTDFLGQWLTLYKVNATAPDEKLYPEYDEVLGDAFPVETELFFRELIEQNFTATNLIDSKFTFVNRRLAEHYGFPGVEGLGFQKIELPADSPRGGVLTQAAVLKTTANGTVTSPVTRGNFVLTNFFGTPPSPPPPTVGSIEPDTRGKTTIREILAAHRDNESCNKCHRVIDPPGFALESFDPIGGYRKKYRANATGYSFFGKTYKNGPSVDASGVSANGEPFDGIQEFKALLMKEKELVARNFISQLVVFATGAEIQFADRDAIDAILNSTRSDDFRVRDIIHEIVQSDLFRNK